MKQHTADDDGPADQSIRRQGVDPHVVNRDGTAVLDEGGGEVGADGPIVAVGADGDSLGVDVTALKVVGGAWTGVAVAANGEPVCRRNRSTGLDEGAGDVGAVDEFLIHQDRSAAQRATGDAIDAGDSGARRAEGERGPEVEQPATLIDLADVSVADCQRRKLESSALDVD